MSQLDCRTRLQLKFKVQLTVLICSVMLTYWKIFPTSVHTICEICSLRKSWVWLFPSLNIAATLCSFGFVVGHFCCGLEEIYWSKATHKKRGECLQISLNFVCWLECRLESKAFKSRFLSIKFIYNLKNSQTAFPEPTDITTPYLLDFCTPTSLNTTREFLWTP